GAGLWPCGLARLSGRPAPTVATSPGARRGASHRSRLLEGGLRLQCVGQRVGLEAAEGLARLAEGRDEPAVLDLRDDAASLRRILGGRGGPVDARPRAAARVVWHGVGARPG